MPRRLKTLRRRNNDILGMLTWVQLLQNNVQPTKVVHYTSILCTFRVEFYNSSYLNNMELLNK